MRKHVEKKMGKDLVSQWKRACHYGFMNKAGPTKWIFFQTQKLQCSMQTMSVIGAAEHWIFFFVFLLFLRPQSKTRYRPSMEERERERENRKYLETNKWAWAEMKKEDILPCVCLPLATDNGIKLFLISMAADLCPLLYGECFSSLLCFLFLSEKVFSLLLVFFMACSVIYGLFNESALFGRKK